MSSPKRASDFVIGMTLAEVFLLLLFLIWWAVAAERAAIAGTDGTISAAVLAQQVAELTTQNKRLNERVEKLQTDLEALRVMYGAASTSPDDIIKGVQIRVRDARRGAPRCVEDSNTLIEADVVDGITTVRLALTADPTTLASLGDSAVTFRAGQELRDNDIDRFLARVAIFYAAHHQCRFDYALNYRTDSDYRIARTTLEQYFYPTSHIVQVTSR